MRKAAVIYFSRGTSLEKSLAEALSEGIKSQGITCDLISFADENISVSGYKYIALGVNPKGLFSTVINEQLDDFLKQTVFNPTTKFYIFSPAKGVRMNKKLVDTMSLVESYGLFIKNSGIIKDIDDAFQIGKELHIKDHL